MAETGICIVGCGDYGAVHASCFGAMEGVRLFFSSRDGAKASGFAGRFGGEALPSFEAALGEERVHGVVLCTPHHRHLEGARAVLGSGKSLLIEKPLARSSAEGEEIAGACSASRSRVLLGENYAFLPVLGPLRGVLERGGIGRVLRARAVHRKRYVPSGWRLERRLMGGGLLADMGPHYLRLLQMLLGPVRRVRLEAARHPIARMEGESEFELSLEFEEVGEASLEVSWSRDWDRSIPTLLIEGEAGSLSFVMDGAFLEWRKGAELERLPVDAPFGSGACPPCEDGGPLAAAADGMGRKALARHFLDVVRGEAEPVVGVEEGLRDLRVVEAAYRSLKEERWEEP